MDSGYSPVLSLLIEPKRILKHIFNLNKAEKCIQFKVKKLIQVVAKATFKNVLLFLVEPLKLLSGNKINN